MVETQDNPPTRRLFLALWPNASERRQIAALARPLTGGRKVTVENLHLTLIFLGNTDSKRQKCYERALQDLQAPSFTLRLDTIGYWPKPRILWLGTSQPSNDLADLVRDLQDRLSGCGYKPETRPFNAHVTLARSFPGPPPNVAVRQPIRWFIQRIALLESCPQAGRVHYRILRYWPEH